MCYTVICISRTAACNRLRKNHGAAGGQACRRGDTMEKTGREAPPARPDTLVWGKNPVTELLKSGAAVDTVYLADTMPPAVAGYYTALAKNCGAVVKRAPGHKLQKLCGTAEHQGVAARAAEVAYAALDDLLAAANAKGEAPFLVLCDGVEDPHNLGAIIRSASSASGAPAVTRTRHSAFFA